MLSWDHNAYYQRLLLRQVPADAGRGLDVGCGAGHLAEKLAERVGHLDALDRDQHIFDLAGQRVPRGVDCLLGDVLDYPLEPAVYDVIVSMSALHHLFLASALPRLAEALHPGGVLAAIALPRVDLPRELPVEVAGSVWHLLVGLGLVTRF